MYTTRQIKRVVLNLVSDVTSDSDKAKLADNIVKELQKKSKSRKGQKSPGTPRVTRDSLTLELVKEGKYTLNEIFKKVLKQFPTNDSDTLRDTTSRRLKGHLNKKYGVTIVKNDAGIYSIKGTKKSPVTKKSPKTQQESPVTPKANEDKK